MAGYSYARVVEDTGEPCASLDIAGQAVRDFNHRAIDGMRLTLPGWRYAPDAYRAPGELSYLAGGLPQAFQQILAAPRHEQECNLIAIDRGTMYEGRPDPADEAASVALKLGLSRCPPTGYPGLPTAPPQQGSPAAAVS